MAGESLTKDPIKVMNPDFYCIIAMTIHPSTRLIGYIKPWARKPNGVRHYYFDVNPPTSTPVNIDSEGNLFFEIVYTPVLSPGKKWGSFVHGVELSWNTLN